LFVVDDTIRYDICLLKFDFHPVAVVLTLVHKSQEQKYTQGGKIEMTEHTK